MTELLGKLFVKDYKDTGSRQVRRGWGTLVSIVGIIMNVLLFAGKFIVGTLFGAISISADAINNLSDAGSQFISLISFRLAAKPADRKHPFGYARIEYISSMIVSFLIIHIGFDMLKDSADKIIHPGEPTEFSWLSVAVLGVSILVKIWLAFFNKSVGKRIGSAVMEATAADSLSDVISTSAVLVSQIILLMLDFDPDAYLGVLVSLLIMWAGIGIMRTTMDSLLGEAPDPEMVEDVLTIVRSHPEVLGIHDLMAHNYGPGFMIISLHVEVDGAVDVFISHDTIDEIEKEIRDKLGYIATIHLDPIVTDDVEVLKTKLAIIEKISTINPGLHIHDFRLVRGNTHTNLIFDVEAPFELRMTDDELKVLIAQKATEIDEKYRCVINVDKV